MKTASCAAEAAPLLLSAIPIRLRKVQECFVLLCLDTSRHVLGKALLIAVGGLTSVEVHLRDVFREAVRRNAASIIVAHQHPSGSIEPSTQDRMLTSRLKIAGQLLEIEVLDHLIINPKKPLVFCSMAEREML